MERELVTIECREWHSCPEGWRRSGFFQSVKPASAEDTTCIWLALALPAKWWGRGKKMNKKKRKREDHSCAIILTAAYTHNSSHPSSPPSAAKFLHLPRPCCACTISYILNIAPVLICLQYWNSGKFSILFWNPLSCTTPHQCLRCPLYLQPLRPPLLWFP